MLSSMPAALPLHLHISLTITLQCRTKSPVSNVRTVRVLKPEYLVQGQVEAEPGLSPQESHQRLLFTLECLFTPTRAPRVNTETRGRDTRKFSRFL